MHRFRRERGSSALEFIVALPYLVLAAAFVVQLLLMGAAATAAENAARTGSRAESRGSSGSAAAREALPAWLRDDADTSCRGSGGTRVSVCVKVPVIFPALGFPKITLSRTAELPPPA
jgi:hypothetical protein